MKKATTILVIIIQISLLFIFQNIYYLFKEYEVKNITDPAQFKQNMQTLKKIFSILSIIMILLFIGTSIYFVVQLRKEKKKPQAEGLPPLQDYLFQLKTSETELKSKVKTHQEDVKIKEELNKNIINNINAAIILINPSNRIEIFNSMAEKLFNQSFSHAKNNLIDKVLKDFPEILYFISQNKSQTTSKEIVSKEKIFLVHLRLIEDIGVLIITSDITSEKMREEIDRRNSNFIMLGEMTTFLAHEVRNSLGVIYGYTKTIKSEKEKIDRVNREIKFLTTMMESFLNFSKPIIVNKKETVNMSQILKKISLEKEIALEVDDEDVSLENDPILLYSVFSNLILNSKESGATAIIVSIKKGKDLEIILKDNGKGIDPKVKDKIWLPFFTTKEKGTGMGLAIIRKIINTLRGDIVLSHSDGGGTAFKITFYS
jgi:signal transduction histidine kinase